MAEKLIIAEKHNVAKKLAKIVGANKACTEHKNGTVGWIEGNGWIVSWCAGHIIQPSYPDKYDSKYKYWNLEDLPIIPQQWKYEPSSIEPAKTQFKKIKELFDSHEIEIIYHAGDADREGEMIVREVLRQLGKTNIPAKRVWSSNLTDTALKKALDDAKPLSEYDSVGLAADLRQKLDWIYGLNLTRAYTSYAHSTQNVGRVVSPTINLIVEKQREIDAFVPEDYGVVSALLKNEKGEFTAKARYDDIEKAKQVAKKIENKSGTISSVDESEEVTSRKLYDLTQLQADASARFGYEPNVTSDIAQKLYENGWQSYPRTNSNVIYPEQIDETKPMLVSAWKSVFVSPKQISPSDFDIMRIVEEAPAENDAKDASHPGICPTMQGIEEYQSKIRGDEKMRNIFLLVTCRLLCSCLPPRRCSKTKIGVDIDDEVFSASGSVELDPGFTAFEKYIFSALKQKKQRKKTEEQALPKVFVGEIFNVKKSSYEAKQTKPPKPYTTSQLITTMKFIAKLLPEKKMKDILRSKDAGLGTQSSRDTVIATIKKNGFVVLKGGYLYPTDKAKHLMEILPDDIKSPILTATMELELNDVAAGNKSADEFMSDVRKTIIDEIEDTKKLPPIPDTKRYADNKLFMPKACPKCGADIVETPKSVVCKNNCGFVLWRTIAKKKLTISEIKHILSEGFSSAKLEGFKSKAGKEFSVWLYIDPSDGYRINFDFDNAGEKAKAQNFKATHSSTEDAG